MDFVQKKPFPKAKPHGKEYRQRSPVKMANGIPDRPEAKPKEKRENLLNVEYPYKTNYP